MQLSTRRDTMKDAPKGERKCEDCTFYHPERQKRPCSAFGQLENKRGDCCLYIETKRAET